jgi:polyhydroxybutyrate depolymerase
MGGQGSGVAGLFALAVSGALVAGCAPDRVVLGRPVELTLPAGVDATTPLPLVVFLHGFTGNGVFDDKTIVKLRAQVDAKKFIYAQPNGTPNKRGQRYWNATDGCCAPADSHVDDVAFLRAVIADAQTQHPVDPARVFLVGFSNGGFMALRMACDASDVVTAVVNIAGSTWIDPARCGPGRPVSILHLHGTADATIRFEGSSAPARSPSPVGRYVGAKETNARFAARNGCATTLESLPALDVEKRDGVETSRERYTGCPAGGAVELWTMDGVGHVPRLQPDAPARLVDWLGEHPR